MIMKNDIIEDTSDETTKLTKQILINEKSCVSCKRPRENENKKIPFPKKIASTLPEVDVHIGRCNLIMKLPKSIVCIKLRSKKNKSKLDDTNESKTNTKLHINNKTINV